MSTRPDLSIGQRLAIGFGAIFLLMAALLVSSYVLLARNGALLADVTGRTLPLQRGAHELERSVLNAGLAVRTYFIAPTPERLAQHDAAARDARAALDALAAMPMDGESARMFQESAAAVERYLSQKRELVRAFQAGAPAPAHEKALAVARGDAVSTLRRLVQLQERKADETLATVTAARQRIIRELALVGAIAGFGFGILAWVTARSIRNPARMLAGAAEALERGDWAPALALSPRRDGPAAPPPARDEMTTLARALGAAAVALERFVADLKATNERIQAQSEELQAQNEEIQAQSEELQSQNEEIQAQSEELQAQNEEIQAQADELEERGVRLTERNAELERLAQTLREQAAQLSEADARKNEFLGMLAHELRNPMAAMAVSLQLLRRVSSGTERAARAQEVLERQVRHMTRLIDDLLDITRISQGKIAVQRERLDLRDVVRTCLDDVAGLPSARAVSLESDVPDDAVWVNGDRTRLCQVLGNLLHNALKFTPDGGCIRIRLARQPESGEAELRVTDSGAGIDPDLLTRVFDPFVQGHTSLARTGGGLGLGLALVRALVERHEGTVAVASEGPGHGAEFTVRLPLAAADDHTPPRRHAAPPVRPRRVLIVEDNEDAAWSLREALALEGHIVQAVETGAEALEVARAFEPDLVICDIGLPAMDGYEFARRLRVDPRLNSTVLVALTGYASDADRAQSADAGFDAHLAKPLRMEELAAVLASASNPT